MYTLTHSGGPHRLIQPCKHQPEMCDHCVSDSGDSGDQISTAAALACHSGWSTVYWLWSVVAAGKAHRTIHVTLQRLVAALKWLYFEALHTKWCQASRPWQICCSARACSRASLPLHTLVASHTNACSLPDMYSFKVAAYTNAPMPSCTASCLRCYV
jgi:hypothetical protein